MNLVRTTLTLLLTACLTMSIQAEEKDDYKAEMAQSFAALGVAVQDKDPSVDYVDKVALIENFTNIGLSVLDIQPSNIAGIVEVTTAKGVLFSSPDGKQFIAGTLYAQAENGEYVDVLEERQAPINAAKIEAMKDSMITFKADDEKFVVTVFTDTSCGYCVRLHQDMQGHDGYDDNYRSVYIRSYNELGITVRYVAYPRQGLKSEPAEQLAQIWCAGDQKQAMHDAMLQQKFAQDGKNIEQCRQMVSEHYQLGRELGISGTPAIFTSGGKIVGGYLSPEKLYQRLMQM